MKIAVAEEYLVKYLMEEEIEKEGPYEEDPTEPQEEGGIGLLSFNGFITQYSAEDFERGMRILSMNDGIRAIVLSMNTPGGDVNGSVRMKSAIQGAGKPVVVHTSFLASGGVLATLPAEKIIASDDMADIGSIGVVFTYNPPFLKMIKEYQKMVFAKQSPRKMEEFRALMEGDETLVQRKVDKTAEMFQKEVMKFRNLKGDTKSTLSGAMFTGKSAKRRGLVDAIGTFSDALGVASRL